jgi:hypothetical protein
MPNSEYRLTNGVQVNTDLLLLVYPGRLPVVTCGPTEDADSYRLSVEVLRPGCGASVHIRGPLPTLRELVNTLSDAIDQQ